MSNTEQELAFYREQISKWRQENWSWERIRMEDCGPGELERELEGWAKAGEARLTPEEWLDLVQEAEQKERWEIGKDAVNADNVDEMCQYFQYRLAKAPTKVGNLLRKLQAEDFVRAREIASGSIPFPAGFGSKTLSDLREWLQRWDPVPLVPVKESSDAQTTAMWTSLPVPDGAGDRFLQKLKSAPASIQYVLSELKKRGYLMGAADFCRLDIDMVAEAVKIKKVGKKAWGNLKTWQQDILHPCRYSCAAYVGWNAWLGAIIDDIFKNAVRDLKGKLEIFERRMGLACEQAGPLPTLDEIGQSRGLTRERVRQVEVLFLTGGGNSRTRGIYGNMDKFDDFLRIMGEVFEKEGVLSMEQFGKRLSERSPWPGEDFRYRAARLLAVLEHREPDQVPGFATFHQEERIERRYETFKEAVEKDVSRRLDVSYEPFRWLMTDYGVQDFGQDEFEYCRARAGREQEVPSTIRRMVRDPTKGDFARQALLEIFEPEMGYQTLTQQEMERRLWEKLGDAAPNVRSFLNRKPPIDLDGNGTVICLVDEGGGVGRLSQYALSKFLPRLEPDIIPLMEEELRAHLKAYGIEAALVTPFYEPWMAKGWLPKGMTARVLFDELCRRSSRTIVDYPEGNSSCAFSLPGAVLSKTRLLKSQAILYFRGMAVVPKRVLQEFAEHGFGLSKAMKKIECERQFKSKAGMCFLDESLLDK